ncbi:MAG TPA: LysR substrate-binding domain-containing protein [Verrucomicrobiae bacterium]|nr:LysR substrate-binding domain-containing protein [Verrucomicrobiae bacterium]
MELHHLRCFIAVAEHLGFTRAGQALHVSQPALTRSVHKLESEMGVQLLHRSKTSVALTPEGRLFLNACKQGIEVIERGVRDARNAADSGTLSLGYSIGFDFPPMLEAIAAFHQQAPQVEIKLHDLPLGKLLKNLQSLQLDAAFIGCSLAQEPTLAWQCLAQHPVAVVLPSRHPLARRRSILLQELRSLHFVSLSEEAHPGFRDWLCSVCGTAGFSPKILQHVETEQHLEQAVASGVGVTLTGGRPKRAPFAGVAVRPLTPEVLTGYSMAWNPGNRSKALHAYLDALRQVSPCSAS